MRTFDPTPLFNTTVGFDRISRMIDSLVTAESNPSYPPYNIERRGDKHYRITFAVAGFSPEDITIEARDNALLVVGKGPQGTEENIQILHRGIAQRGFKRQFVLADHIHVVGAAQENGLLHIDLERIVPEALKPRIIPIAIASKSGTPEIPDAPKTGADPVLADQTHRADDGDIEGAAV